MCRLYCHLALQSSLQSHHLPSPTHSDRERVVIHTGSNFLRDATSFLSCLRLPASPHPPAHAGLLTCFPPVPLPRRTISALFTFDKKPSCFRAASPTPPSSPGAAALTAVAALFSLRSPVSCFHLFISSPPSTSSPHLLFSPLPPSHSYSLPLCEPAVCH